LFRLDAHLARLYASAAIHGIQIPYGAGLLEEAICETISRNGFESCYVRPICYYGSRALSVDPRACPVEIAVLAWPWAAYLGVEGLERGVRVTVSPWRKFESQALPTTAKACGQYVNSILAVREAVDRGYDEALLLDAAGNIAEGSGENLFVVRDGRLVTNDERSSILLGVTRDSVIELARTLGYQIDVGTITIDDLRAADEAFFTGTAAEVTPIREVDGWQIGDGKRGPVTERIQRAFFAITEGRDARFTRWLHAVNNSSSPAAVSAVAPSIAAGGDRWS
jgi:branched-chain amino acid aminotransferase